MAKIVGWCLLFLMTSVAKAGAFLTLADIHYVSGSTNPQETSEVLWHNSQAEMRTLIQTVKPQFMVVLGDLPGYHHEARIRNMRQVLHDLNSLSSVPMFYVPGNNDALGGDYHSFTNDQGDNVYRLDPAHAWPALHTAQDCPLVHPSQSACLLDKHFINPYGYYAAYPLGPAKHWRLVVLNSVLFVQNRWLIHYVSDDGVSQAQAAKQQLTWLHQQLAEAHEQHDRVLIAMHIPPGLDAYSHTPMWNESFLTAFMTEILNYHTEITGILTGHTHMDEFRRLHDALGHTTVLAMACPGISPIHGNNPSLKVFLYNDQHDLTDAITYYTPLIDRPQWQSYAFKKWYGCQQSTLVQCIANFSIDDPRFQVHYQSAYAVFNMAYHPKDWSSIFQAIEVPASE